MCARRRQIYIEIHYYRNISCFKNDGSATRKLQVSAYSPDKSSYLSLFLYPDNKGDWLPDSRALSTRDTASVYSPPKRKYSGKYRSLHDIRLLRFVIPPGNHSFSPPLERTAQRQRIPMKPSTEIQIRFATRAVYPYFDSRRTDVFRFEAFLEAAIDCRYSSFRFLFRSPLCSFSLPGARFSSSRSPVVKSKRGRAIFPRRDSSELMIPERG